MEIDGSEESELGEVILVGPDTWEGLAVVVSYGLKQLLLCVGNGVGRRRRRRRTGEDKGGVFGGGSVGEVKCCWGGFGVGAKGNKRGEQ